MIGMRIRVKCVNERISSHGIVSNMKKKKIVCAMEMQRGCDVCMCVHLSICLSACLSLCLSVYLSVCV
jgi:hypothetical protein